MGSLCLFESNKKNRFTIYLFSQEISQRANLLGTPCIILIHHYLIKNVPTTTTLYRFFVYKKTMYKMQIIILNEYLKKLIFCGCYYVYNVPT